MITVLNGNKNSRKEDKIFEFGLNKNFIVITPKLQFKKEQPGKLDLEVKN